MFCRAIGTLSKWLLDAVDPLDAEIWGATEVLAEVVVERGVVSG